MFAGVKEGEVMRQLSEGVPIREILNWLGWWQEKFVKALFDDGFQDRYTAYRDTSLTEAEGKVKVKQGLNTLNVEQSVSVLRSLVTDTETSPGVKRQIIEMLLKQAGILAGDEEKLSVWFMPAEESRRWNEALVQSEKDTAEREAKDNDGDGRKRSVLVQPTGTVQEAE